MRVRTTVNSPARAPSAEDLEHVVDLSSPCTTNESSCFKENINLNKSETPKLCLEPLQMKRKKKGGGYNLRKSLAWDKAFFSEEGVLDPVELSIISGTSCREELPFINGEFPGSPHLLIKPLDLKKLEKDGQTVWSSPKIDSSSSKTRTATSLTSHKFPTPLANKSGSRCGDCPRPLPPSSLKRPANVNVGKAAGKDLKLPKVPGLKPSLSPICATPTNTILQKNCVKHNQITKPDFNIQRNPGSKNFPKSHQNNQSASKASSLRPVCYADEISGNSSSKRLSSVNTSPVLVDKIDNPGSKMISDIITSARPVNSSETQQKSISFAVSSSRNAHVSGITMQPLQNHPIKPSGLRMPSPSLSFFSQPKQSVFQDLPLRDKETDLCKSQKHENSSLLEKLRRPPKIDCKTPASAIKISKAISSSSECMASSHISDVDVIKPKMDRKHMHKILDISKNRSGWITREDVELQKIDNELPSESGKGEQMMDDKFVRKATEGYREEACITDYHKPQREQTDPTKDSLGETDKHKNVLSAEKKTSEHLGVSQLNGSSFRGSASTIEALEHSRAKAKNSDFGSNHVPEDLLNITAFTEVSTEILMGNVAMENTVLASSVGDYRNDINLTSEVDDDTIKSGKEMDPPRNAESNTGNRLLPEKQLCLRNPQQEKNVEKLISVVPFRKVGKKLIDTKTASTPSLGNMHDCNFDEDKMTGQLPVRTEFDFVDDSLSSESPCSLVDVSFNLDFKGNANYLSNTLHQDTQRTEIDYCISFQENRSRQGSQENTLGKVTEKSVITLDGSADSRSTSNMALKESESGISLLDSGSVVMQSSEINMLNECCADDTELLTLPSGEFVVENVGDHNHGLHFENAKESTEALVTGQTELYVSTSRSTSFSANRTPLRDENCNDACGIRGYTADVIPNLSRVEPFSETSKSEVSEDTNSSFSFLHPKTDLAKAEAAVTPNKKIGEDLNDKSRLCVLPPNAIPFSDEWLAAIEAAGEDILTQKSGAVQNSPPDKSLPEPGPWSPVKRKNNQIGPFDCTKCTTVVPSDSG